MTLGIKKCTLGRKRSLAYSLFYAMLTIGLFIAGPVVDFLRTVVGGKHFWGLLSFSNVDTTIQTAHADYTFSSYRLIFFVGFILTFIGFLLIFFFFNDVDIEE